LSILALIFMLILVMSEVTSSQESQVDKEDVLRRASLRWMQVGIEQYERTEFSGAELSFRRARVFQKNLTDAERQKLEEYLANTRIAISDGKQALAITQTADESVELDQPVKAEVDAEKVKDSLPTPEEGRRQTAKAIGETSDKPRQQNVESVRATELSASKIQFEARSSQDEVIVMKDKSFKSEFMRLSDWLSQNRRNVIMICLPVLAVLIFISKLQAGRKRPGRRVYTHHVPQNSSFIGSKLNVSNKNSRAVKKSKNGRSASSSDAENPKRKSFTQTTAHWKEKHTGHAPAAGKSFRTNEKWPQRKDKFEDDNPALAKEEQKLCLKCNKLKALSEFHKDKSCKAGLARWCKECKADAAKKSRKKRASGKK